MRRYSKIWRHKQLPFASSLGDLVLIMQDAANELHEMAHAGVDFEHLEDGSYLLCTYSKEIARMFDMTPD